MLFLAAVLITRGFKPSEPCPREKEKENLRIEGTPEVIDTKMLSKPGDKPPSSGDPIMLTPKLFAESTHDPPLVDLRLNHLQVLHSHSSGSDSLELVFFMYLTFSNMILKLSLSQNPTPVLTTHSLETFED